MTILKKLFYSLPWKFRVLIREIYTNKSLKEYIKIQYEFKKIFDSFLQNKDSLTVSDDPKEWFKSFRKFLRFQPLQKEVAFEFFLSKIKIEREGFEKSCNTDCILICVVKNDLLKMKEFIKYHKNIGITYFAIIDNNSTDGTYEWLIQQENVTVFKTLDKYTTDKREAWINRVIAYYGLNKWYLILDSDELFSFSRIEENKIQCLLNFCKNNKIKRVRSLMVDMYAEKGFYLQKSDENYLDKCCYFDTESYEEQNRDYLDLVVGGPRGRVFGQKAWLTKYPLVYFEKGDIQGKSHFPFPYFKNKNSKCYSAILHYKFLPSDIQKYRKIAMEGNYYNGSEQYKNYLKIIDSNVGLSFIDNKSIKFESSESLYAIPLMEYFKKDV